MQNYFNSNVLRLSTLEQNKINGKSAERYLAATLTIALEARVSWSSRTEDDSKVDLVSIITHPWLLNRVEVLFTQVKSGKSFAELSGGVLNVKKSKFKVLLERNHHTLVCWTKVDEEILYWFIIKADSKFFKTEYNESHKLSPASRFDITRILTSASNKNGGKGLNFSRKNSKSDYKTPSFRLLRLQAKSLYKDLIQQEMINPLFGKVECSRLGWRHITRESRLNIFKIATFEIMPVLKEILNKTPTNHYLLNHKQELVDNYWHRENEYILHYPHVKCYDREQKKVVNVMVYVKVLEFIAFTDKWRDSADAANDLRRRVVFKSVYYK